MARVYVSSTFDDLKAFREAVYRALRKMGHDVVAMEDMTAVNERPLAKCLEDVGSCDIYIGLFAWRYGFTPPGEKKSITELEWQHAHCNDKSCLIFLLGEKASWPAIHVDDNRDEIRRLRKELQNHYVVSFFENEDQLAAGVSAAIAAFSPSPQAPLKIDDASRRFYQTCLGNLMERLSGEIRLYTRATILLVVLGTLVGGFGIVAVTDAYQQQIVGLGGLLLGGTSVFPFATLRRTGRMHAVLLGYETELANELPAPDALAAVKRFIDRHLKG